MQPEDQQQPTEDKQVSRGIMRVGQRCGETLADEIEPASDVFRFGSTFGKPFGGDAAVAVAQGEEAQTDQVDHSAATPTDGAV